MRLRLTIHRPLPTSEPRFPVQPTVAPAKILWNHNPSPSSSDLVSELLGQISAVHPLEQAGNGLENYIVELGGYELLHFSAVSEVLRDEDEVVVRPLTSVEIRERRLSGRNQITSAGRRLVDGVPWGRPFVRLATDREVVALRSPPGGDGAGEASGEERADRGRKRQRVEFENEFEGAPAEGVRSGMPTGVLLTHMGELNSEDDEEDSDFAPGESEGERSSDGEEEGKDEGQEDDVFGVVKQESEY